MKCPSCKSPLLEKNAGGMTLDICYGGCGGIWFDAAELERVTARAAATLHTIWQSPIGRLNRAGPPLCPRCPGQVLQRKWFSEMKSVEIDQCPGCDGIWLDAGEFSRIYEEIKGPKVAPPGWASAMAEAAAVVKQTSLGGSDPRPTPL
jgi:Zn-finger nucleic acid-binding protein